MSALDWAVILPDGSLLMDFDAGQKFRSRDEAKKAAREHQGSRLIPLEYAASDEARPRRAYRRKPPEETA